MSSKRSTCFSKHFSRTPGSTQGLAVWRGPPLHLFQGFGKGLLLNEISCGVNRATWAYHVTNVDWESRQFSKTSLLGSTGLEVWRAARRYLHRPTSDERQVEANDRLPHWRRHLGRPHHLRTWDWGTPSLQQSRGAGGHHHGALAPRRACGAHFCFIWRWHSQHWARLGWKPGHLLYFTRWQGLRQSWPRELATTSANPATQRVTLTTCPRATLKRRNYAGGTSRASPMTTSRSSSRRLRRKPTVSQKGSRKRVCRSTLAVEAVAAKSCADRLSPKGQGPFGQNIKGVYFWGSSSTGLEPTFWCHEY